MRGVMVEHDPPLLGLPLPDCVRVALVDLLVPITPAAAAAHGQPAAAAEAGGEEGGGDGCEDVDVRTLLQKLHEAFLLVPDLLVLILVVGASLLLRLLVTSRLLLPVLLLLISLHLRRRVVLRPREGSGTTIDLVALIRQQLDGQVTARHGLADRRKLLLPVAPRPGVPLHVLLLNRLVVSVVRAIARDVISDAHPGGVGLQAQCLDGASTLFLGRDLRSLWASLGAALQHHILHLVVSIDSARCHKERKQEPQQGRRGREAGGPRQHCPWLSAL
mmetsp:Transcript_63421/g.163185  ORF Transcript_63421/g.163185 Transcript_63421/m.163185 type:complete len:275 (+) Transcript_63421:1326-2150(+)